MNDEKEPQSADPLEVVAAAVDKLAGACTKIGVKHVYRKTVRLSLELNPLKMKHGLRQMVLTK